jgi:hypothetical protein
MPGEDEGEPKRPLRNRFARSGFAARVNDPCDDLEAYRRLLQLSEDLDKMAERCWSVASEQSLHAAAAVARKIASKLYQRSLRDDDDRLADPE